MLRWRRARTIRPRRGSLCPVHAVAGGHKVRSVVAERPPAGCVPGPRAGLERLLRGDDMVHFACRRVVGDPGVGVSLAGAVIAPANSFALRGDGTRVVLACGDGGVGAVRRIQLALVVPAPTDGSALCCQRACVCRASGNGGVGTLGLIPIDAPADGLALRGQPGEYVLLR